MIKAGNISKGMFILTKNEPHIVVEREFVNPGKGSGFVRVKLKNLRTGLTIKQTIKSQETVEDIEVENLDVQFLYSDNDNYHFMDNNTYEQYAVLKEGLDESGAFLKEGIIVQLIMWEKRPIEIKLPYKMTFEVTEAESAIKGNTVTGGTKLVTIETGLKIKAPLFIKRGEKIVINTETKEYVERAK